MIRCRWCGVRIVEIDMLMGGSQWHHKTPQRQFLTCERWPHPSAEPEPWTVVDASEASA